MNENTNIPDENAQGNAVTPDPALDQETGKVININQGTEKLEVKTEEELPEETTFDAKKTSPLKAKTLDEDFEIPFHRGSAMFFLNLFGRLMQVKGGIKWNYFVTRNIEMFNRIQQAIQNWQKKNFPKDPRVQELSDKELTLFQEWAEKDEMGNPKMKGQNFDIPESKRKEFDTVRKALVEEYKDTKPLIEEYNTKFNEYINSNVQIKPYLIKSEELPADISPDSFRFLDSFVVD